MSRPPAAKIFTALDLARQMPEYSRTTLLISALSAEKHTHFLSQLDVFIGVNYEGGMRGVRKGRWIMGIVYIHSRKAASFPPI